jgi:hypothetical protein
MSNGPEIAAVGVAFGESRFWPPRVVVILQVLRPCACLREGLKLDQIRQVVAQRYPGGAGAGDREGRIERETGQDGGTSLVEAAKPRQGSAQVKICSRIISVGLDRPSTPSDRLLPTAEVVLRDARAHPPGVCHSPRRRPLPETLSRVPTILPFGGFRRALSRPRFSRRSWSLLTFRFALDDRTVIAKSIKLWFHTFILDYSRSTGQN